MAAGSPFDCTLATAPAVTLGTAHGTTIIIDNLNVYTGTDFTQLDTNATHGAVINMSNSNTTCSSAGGGLSADNGTTCAIPAVGAGAGTPSGITAGTAAFGLFVANSVITDPTGTGTVTPSGAYFSPSHCGPTSASPPICPNTGGAGNFFYGMDTTTSPALYANAGNAYGPANPPTGSNSTGYTGNVTSTLGSTIASTPSPVYKVDNGLTFAATSSLVTPAGIYTANMNLVATGTF
jgi:hypothetical protein